MDIQEIIKRIKKGDQIAFRQLVEQHQAYAFKLAFRIVCDEEDARDVVQDSFVKVWRNIGIYSPSVKFTTWLFKIVTNTAIDQYRKNEIRKSATFDESIDHHPELNPSQADNKELARLIEVLAKGLPEKQRMVFVLRDLQSLDSKEVQEILDMTETVIKSNLYYARKSVKEKLMKLVAYERRIT